MVLKNKIAHPILTVIIPTFNEVNNISKIVEKLDKLSLEKKRQLTIPLIKEIL